MNKSYALTETAQDVLAAWDAGDPVALYAPHGQRLHEAPSKEDRTGGFYRRWFLRTEPHDGARHWLLIGMNPSTAIAFAPEGQGGDLTTGALMTGLVTHPRRDVGDALSAVGAEDRRLDLGRDQVTVVNLSPWVQPDSSKASNSPYVLTADTNLALLDRALGWADVIIPVWGNTGDPKCAWKRELLAGGGIADLVATHLTSRPGLPVIMVCGARALGTRKGFPRHPAYGWWVREDSQVVAGQEARDQLATHLSRFTAGRP